jgi:putative ABC transport system substrate-binding protein
MHRRSFITILGGAAAWPLAARGQQPDRMRRIGVLTPYAEDDKEAQLNVKMLEQTLGALGWIIGRSVEIEHNWTGGITGRTPMLAKKVVELHPDVVVARGTPVVRALLQESRAIPIVFVSVADPVGDGFVASIAHPGSNVTGFTNYESSMSGKWIELLKEIAPNVKRVALLFNPETTPGNGTYFLRSFRIAAPAFALDSIAAPASRAAEIEAAIMALGREPGGGLIVMPDISMMAHRELIASLAAQHHLPGVYTDRSYAIAGGLLSYGTDITDLYRRAASYVDRVLRGEKPGDLPVQAPTKFDFVINLKAAKALGLTVPASLLARADEVIE